MTGNLVTQVKKNNPATEEQDCSGEEKKAINEGPKAEVNLDQPRPKKRMLECLFFSRPRKSRTKQRYSICILAHFGFFLLYIMRTSLSISIVKMTKPYLVVEGDHIASKIDFDWSLKEQGIILSAFFFGYIVTQIPGGCMAAHYGGRKIFGFGLFLASAATFITPVMGEVGGFYGFVLVRILCGLAQGLTFPAIHAMWNYWAPPLERTTLVTMAFSGSYFGAAASMLVFVYGDQASHWMAVLMITGMYGFGLAFIWLMWGGEYPEEDPMISDEELKYITETVGCQCKKSALKVPWLKILLSPRVWAINICHFATNWGFYTMLTELPTYLSSAWKLDQKTMATYAFIPFFGMYLGVFMGGYVVDRIFLRLLNTTKARKVTACFSFLVQMMFFFLAGKATATYDFLFYITVALTFSGFSWSGFSPNHLDIAPEYASVLLGISNTFATIPGIISPLLTGYLVENEDDPESWSPVFLIAGYISLIAAVFYVIFGSGELQDWANPNESQKLNSCKKQESAAIMEAGGTGGAGRE